MSFVSMRRLYLVVCDVPFVLRFVSLCNFEFLFCSISSLNFLYSLLLLLSTLSNSTLFNSAIAILSSKLVFTILTSAISSLWVANTFFATSFNMANSFNSFESFCYFKIRDFIRKCLTSLFLLQQPLCSENFERFIPFYCTISFLPSYVRVVNKDVRKDSPNKFKSPKQK